MDILASIENRVNQSITWHLKKKLGWHSILIEPQPSVFLNFKKGVKKLKTIHLVPRDAITPRST